MQECKTGFVYGTGAALNVICGFIPERVEFFNVTDGDIFNVGFPAYKKMAFTSGGTNEIKVGDKIIGTTSGATAIVLFVLADTGTWAGGDAAGTLILDAASETGTFASESIYASDSSGTNDATGAATTNTGYDSDTEIATNTGISPYLGTEAGYGFGFTVATAVSENAKLFAWTAWRSA